MMGFGSPRAALEMVDVELPRPVDEICADLELFAEMLGKWQRVQNLVSRETLADLWTRHVADSLQLLDYWGSGPSQAVDIGSGGGFPALPVAIARKGAGDRLVLAESNGRKTAFLRAVARELGLSLEILDSRVESVQLPFAAADIVTARAVAALPMLLGMVVPFCGPSTRLLLHKGREYGEELHAAYAGWRFDVVEHQSRTDPDAVILEISGLAARDPSQ
jgi:16S rRNA (guanine527-N7)-methyltransferase